MITSLSPQRIVTFREIINDVGQVLFASVLIDPIVGSNLNPILVVSGILLSLSAWILSIYLTK